MSLPCLPCGRRTVSWCTKPGINAAVAPKRLRPHRSWAHSKRAVPPIACCAAPLLSAKGAVWYPSIAGLVSMKNISISCCLCCFSKLRAQCHLWSLSRKPTSSCRGRGVGRYVAADEWCDLGNHTFPDASCKVGVSSDIQLRQGCLWGTITTGRANIGMPCKRARS